MIITLFDNRCGRNDTELISLECGVLLESIIGRLFEVMKSEATTGSVWRLSILSPELIIKKWWGGGIESAPEFITPFCGLSYRVSSY